MYRILRPILFKFPTEFTHHIALNFLKWSAPLHRIKKNLQRFPLKPCKVFDLNFPNPVGLAAGLDKNGDYIDALFSLGFGFIEVGAVTPKPQAGNPKPRLFRLPKAMALINRMGFNNKGVDHLVKNLKARRIPGIVGVNIGKNLTTPIENAYADYEICLRKIYSYADFATLNISSPNTAGLRDLQNETYLLDLLTRIKELQQTLQQEYQKKVPILVKISPDLSNQEIEVMAKIFLQVEIEGIIVANTTIDRTAVKHLKHADEKGGLSGKPLLNKTKHIISYLQQQTKGQIPLIAVGGIMSAEDAKSLLDSGARLVQIYTGLIYQGPSLIRDIVEKL